MLPDESCRFIVADAIWREDVQSLREVCHKNGIGAAVEWSRSGSGGHVWFFFRKLVSCANVRKLAGIVITLE